MSKKSYNPFKMWGSYVGAIVTLIIFFVVSLQEYPGMGYGSSQMIDVIITGKSFLFLLGIALIPIITGFLLGWGIHSLIRRLR